MLPETGWDEGPWLVSDPAPLKHGPPTSLATPQPPLQPLTWDPPQICAEFHYRDERPNPQSKSCHALHSLDRSCGSGGKTLSQQWLHGSARDPLLEAILSIHQDSPTDYVGPILFTKRQSSMHSTVSCHGFFIT